MAGQLDLVITTVTSAFGTSSVIPLGSAATVNGVTFMSFTSVGAVGNTSYDYSILDSSASEIGTATYLSSNNTLGSRTPTKSTNGGAAITASSAALITCTLRAETAATFFNVLAKQTFISSGTYTPTTGMIYAIVEGVGGGGGGSGCVNSTTSVISGAGGGGGGYSRLTITSTYGSQSVVVGAGGAGGTSSGATTAGGDTVFGSSLLTAKGGSGATAGVMGTAYPIGGAGGVAGTGDITVPGTPGTMGSYFSGSLGAASGAGIGGGTFFGPGAIGISPTGAGVTTGSSGRNYGSGGGGSFSVGSTAANTGGAGANGVLIITEFCRQ